MLYSLYKEKVQAEQKFYASSTLSDFLNGITI